jgi:hypothetical protein
MADHERLAVARPDGWDSLTPTERLRRRYRSRRARSSRDAHRDGVREPPTDSRRVSRRPSSTLTTHGLLTLVYHVSTAAAVARAAELSSRFKQALTVLEQRGITADVPRFYILTLDERVADDISAWPAVFHSFPVIASVRALTLNDFSSIRRRVACHRTDQSHPAAQCATRCHGLP